MDQIKPQTLFLIDGSALIYRSHFAFIRNPLINSKGQLVSAVYGFMNALLRLIIKEEPQFLAVVSDTKHKTFRHERYPDYKATREKMPDELTEQLPVIDALVEKMNIPLFKRPGFEADDIIGTLAKQAAEQGIKVRILTGDKDFAQLVTDRIQIINSRDESIWTPDYVREKWGVPPDTIVDLLGLMGDASDNVPGVPGVGTKTAVKLLTEYGSISGLYENLDSLKNPKLREKLSENRDQAMLSRELVTIKTDVDQIPGWESTRLVSPDFDAVREVFQELELFSLMKTLDKVRGQFQEDLPQDAIQEKNYSTVKTKKELNTFLSKLLKKDMVSFDLETTSLDVLTAGIVGISFSWEANQGVYVAIDFPEVQPGEFMSSDMADVLDMLQPFWQSVDIRKTGHNLKYDLNVLQTHGIEVKGVAFDSQLAAYLVNPGGRGYSMDDLSVQYLGYEPIPIETLIGKGKDQITMDLVPLDKISTYAAEDADISLQLMYILQKRITEYKLDEVFSTIELPLLSVLRKMERTGVYIDGEFLREMSVDLGQKMEQVKKKIYEEAGEEFNINSPRQIADILFEKKGIKPIRKTKTGFSTDVNVLQILAKKHVLPRFLLDYRQLSKLKSTYIDTLPHLIHPVTGRVHTSFNQTITATGRLSSTNPNFQNIPVRTELGRDIRKAFKAEKTGWKILAADYSQIELRLMAQYSGDERLIQAFQNNEDIHTATAAHVFGTDLFGVTPEQRRQAKVVNFGIMYGAGPFRMSNELGISRIEAAELISDYFNTYPGIRRYIDETLNFAREKKYVQTMFGRRRPVPDIDASNRMSREGAERVAVNMPIQGTAADIIKLAMIKLDQRLTELDLQTKMILQVHDELVFEMPEKEEDIVVPLIRDTMETAVSLDIPLVVDIGSGENWLEAH